MSYCVTSNLMIITYEDLQREMIKNLKRICNFIDVGITDNIIKNAIEQSSFNQMRNIELEKGRKYGDNNFIFTRSGMIGEGKKAISRNRKIDRFIEKEMKKNYLLDYFYGQNE